MTPTKESTMTKEEIERNFTYHKPFGDQPERYEQLRAIGKVLAIEIQRDCPDSREKSLAFTNLEQAIMWANAAIARNEPPRNINVVTTEGPRPPDQHRPYG